MVFDSFETVLNVKIIFKNILCIGGNYLNKVLTKSLNEYTMPVIMDDNS